MNDLMVNDDKDLETVKVSFELLESKSEELQAVKTNKYLSLYLKELPVKRIY